MNKNRITSNKNGEQSDLWFWFFNVFQHTGDSLFLFPLFASLYLINSGRLKLASGLILGGMALTGIVVFILKKIFRKERPEGSFGKMYRKYDRFSFPSGHAARVSAVVVMVAFFNLPVAICASAWAGLVSLSRLKLQLHALTDVLLGMLVGILVGILTIWVRFRVGFY